MDSFILIFFLRFFAPLSTPASFSHDRIVALHALDHPSNLQLVGTDEFVHFQLFFLDEVETVELAGGEEVLHLESIFAAVYVED